MARREFPEVFEDLASDLGGRLADEARQLYEENYLEAGQDNQTPIEKLMMLSLLYLINSLEWFASSDRENDYLSGCPAPPDFKECAPTGPGILIIPECPVGKYRADFMVRFAGYRKCWAWGAIECDGHDHHDLTKDQAKRDRARDRAFQDQGVLILRYPGSEIWNQPLKCAADALSILERRVAVHKDQLFWDTGEQS